MPMRFRPWHQLSVVYASNGGGQRGLVTSDQPFWVTSPTYRIESIQCGDMR
jgi:hypothetical protein